MITMNKNPNHIAELHLVRAFAIITVVSAHAWDPITGFFFYIPAVHIFFFLSGFFGVKYFKVKSGSIKRTIYHLLARLASVYLFCSFLAVAFKYPLNSFVSRPISLDTILANIFLYPSRHPMIIIWFLYVLFLMNILTLVVNACFKINYRKISHVCIGFSILYLLHLGSFATSFKIFGIDELAQYSIFFFFGFICRLNYGVIYRWVFKYRYAILATTLIYLVYPSIRNVYIQFPFVVLNIFIAWSLAIIILEKEFRIRLYLEKIADYAYGIYVYSYFPQAFIWIIRLQFNSVPDLVYCIASTLAGLLFPIILIRYFFSNYYIFRKWAMGEWDRIYLPRALPLVPANWRSIREIICILF